MLPFSRALCRSLAVVMLATAPSSAAPPEALAAALAKAGGNRAELRKALDGCTPEERPGMEFLLVNMPDADLTALTAEFLLGNTRLAYQARREAPWGKGVPEEIFLNDVLPYANVDERRDAWRRELRELALPIVKGCATPTQAVQKLNAELFGKLNVKYSTQRKAANQSPRESIAQGKASCTGLSIVLSDACRAVGIPARLAGTPLWANKRGNHTWVEVWDQGWHFTGACEPDPLGLDRGWFTADAAQAQKDSPEHAIYAASFRKAETHFPLVWARDNKSVPGENVTERYAAKATAKRETARVLVRVTAEGGGRLGTHVRVKADGDAKDRHVGQSRGETADTNDLLTFELTPGRDYTVTAAGKSVAFKTVAAGQQQTVVVAVPSVAPDGAKSAAALQALRAELAKRPVTWGALAERDYAKVPLTRADAAAARALLDLTHRESLRAERAAELKGRKLTDGPHVMRFDVKTFGEAPKSGAGRSLWISLHGGGGAPARVNERQWENQKTLYKLDEGFYVAPRAPTDTWNLWHEPHIDRLFARLIEDFVTVEGVNPDRVYLLGYSAGGDGVYQLAPRMADRWAGAAMMAGHPNGVSPLSLRNVPFALQVGADDAAYNRNAVAKEYGEQLARLRAADPKGYEQFVKVHEGRGHWMNLDDKAALPWMAKFSRDPVPDRVVWKQTGTPHDRSYWLGVPAGEAKLDTLVVATRDGQTIDLPTAEGVGTVLVRLDNRVADLDWPVTVTRAGCEPLTLTATRTVGTIFRTLVAAGDPKLTFDAEVAVPAPAKP